MIRLEITKEFQDKVKFLCNEVSDLEWSGILFYDQEGTIKDPENMVIRPREILLMDIGTKGHTEYKFTAEVSNFMFDNNLMLCKYGHIHSHNTFGVFFSGEDDGELNRNCETHNYYLSLIVNNLMQMIAKVVFSATPNSFLCPDEDGEGYELKVKGLKNLMFVYDCDIIKPDTIEVTDTFRERLEVIQKRTAEENKRKAEEAAKKAKEAAEKNKTQQQAGQGLSRGGNPTNPNPGPPIPTTGTANMKALPGGKTKEENFHTSNKGSEDSLFSDEEGLYDDFICFLLRRGSEVKKDTVAAAMIQAQFDFVSGEDNIVESISNNYSTYYDNYYCVDEKGLDTEHFMDCLEEVIATLELEEEANVWTGKLAAELRILGNRAEFAIEQLKNSDKQN